MNYFFADIQDFRGEYPPSNNLEVVKNFKSFSEYLVIAEKVIKKFAPKHMPAYAVKSMLSSEDAISEVARHLMMADWGYKEDKGRTRHSWRNQAAIYAIKSYKDLFKTKANTERLSLDFQVSGDTDKEGQSLYSVTEDILSEQPATIVEDSDRKERIRKYLQFLMKNSKLTPVQEKCLKLRFVEGIESHVEIGNMFDPPISRQAVAQAISRTLFKLKQTAIGSNLT